MELKERVKSSFAVHLGGGGGTKVPFDMILPCSESAQESVTAEVWRPENSTCFLAYESCVILCKRVGSI